MMRPSRFQLGLACKGALLLLRIQPCMPAAGYAVRSRVSSQGGGTPALWTPAAALQPATPMFTPMSDAGPPAAAPPTPGGVVTPFVHPRGNDAAAQEREQHALGSLLGQLQAATQKGANRWLPGPQSMSAPLGPTNAVLGLGPHI